MRWIHATLLFCCGLGLAALIAQSGVADLWTEATALGWAIPVIVALFGVEHVIRTVAWRCCYRPDARPPFTRLFWARLASYAVNTATPSGTIGGEVARASLAGRIPAVESMTAISVDRLADTLSDCTFGACGLAVIITHAQFPVPARLGLLATAALLAVGVGAFFVLQRRGRLAAVVTRRSLARRFTSAGRGARLADHAHAFDRRLGAFHAEYPRALWRAFGLHLVATTIAAVQIACFLAGAGVPVLARTVVQIFVVSIGLDLFSFFVPARLGAQEGARMVAVALVGLPARLGLLLSLVLRVEQLAWALVGFVAYLLLAPDRRPSPVPDERAVAPAAAPMDGVEGLS